MWFTAALLLEDVVEGRPKERTFWEDRIVLLEADDATMQFRKRNRSAIMHNIRILPPTETRFRSHFARLNAFVKFTPMT